MKGDELPGTDHVTRYCRGDAAGSPASFLLRGGESYLSVNWLEFLKKTDRNEEIIEVKKVLSKKLKLGSTARIAVLNVKKTRAHVLQESFDSREINFKHEPESPNDESHSGIHNTRCEDEMLIAELIFETIIEEYPAK